MSHIEHLKKISLDGGLLCLDFINTVSGYMVNDPINYLTNEYEWLTWLKRVKLVEDGFGNFEKDSFNINEILQVREMLYQLFIHYVEEQTIPDKVLTLFNKYCKRMNKHLTIIPDGKEIREILFFDQQSANAYLLPIMRSAKDMLLSTELKNIKVCPNCGWIFLDKTKNNARRWCNMKACGNKMKTQKYYRKMSLRNNEIE